MQVAVIPARVLDKWDFSLYPISNFAYKWLDQIMTPPLFHVRDLNPKLYEKVKPLAIAREARLRLKYVEDFINMCRFATAEREFLSKLHYHWTDDVDIWSMSDFTSVKDNFFTARIQEIIKQCDNHIMKCEVSYICGNCRAPLTRNFLLALLCEGLHLRDLSGES